MIPEAAVTAAWIEADMPDEVTKEVALRILKAAAPHMLAAVWNEGYDYCQGVGAGGFAGNPYEVDDQ